MSVLGSSDCFFCHGHMTSQFLQICWDLCSFAHAISTELPAGGHFSFLVERIFCSSACLGFWSHLTCLNLKIEFLPLKLSFYFNSMR